MHRGTVLGGRKQKARPLKQSHDALSTSLLPGLLRNSEVANTTSGAHLKCPPSLLATAQEKLPTCFPNFTAMAESHLPPSTSDPVLKKYENVRWGSKERCKN